MKKLMLAGIVAVGALTLTACSAGAPEVNGSWGNADVKSEPSLSLSEDGKLFGTDGCNRMNGPFTVEKDTVTFGAIATTMMACEGIDQWLSKAATATVSGDTMTFLNADGEKIGSLERAK